VFFQAEDGIRDDLVTGVQTCALPIFETWILSFGSSPFSGSGETVADAEAAYPSALRFSACSEFIAGFFASSGKLAVLLRKSSSRSEERRVGKEGRGRGARGIA